MGVMPVTTGEIHRTTIDIELDAFEGAREALGTRGYRDTVNGALHAVTRAAALGRGAELIRAGGLGLTTPEELEEMRRVDRSTPS
jgi:Arc/MetJ family transcription regulator